MNNKLVRAAVLSLWMAVSVCLAQDHAQPDLLLLHARVITMNPAAPSAQAIAIAGERITWVGSDAEAQKLFPSVKDTIDLRDATVMPGIIDAHTHLFELGKSLLRLNLKDVATEEEAVARVRERARSARPGEWILGWGWDEGKWAAHYPDNEALSRAAPANPVYLTGLHGFAGWANKKALAIAGVTADTKDPDNGRILRNEKTLEPTGILLNRAQELVESRVPPMSLEQSKKAIELAGQECVRNGLTSVHEARVSPMMLEAYRELLREGRLPLRIYVMLDGADKALARKWLQRGPEIDPQHRLTIRAFKLFADGALGSRGAALLAPYSDAPQSRGVVTTSQADIYDLTRRSLEKGFQVCTHAIGDAANHMTLAAYAQAMSETPSARDPRLRIEHAQVLAADDIPRFSQLVVIPSMQPTHCTSDMGWAEKRVGAERIKGAYAWRSLLETHVHLPLSSDFPGETLNPFYGIYAAITRQDTEGNPPGGWHPEQRLTLDEALRGYTREGAYAEFEEKHKGSIEPGKLADLIVIDKDITQLEARPKEILSIRVMKTYTGGKVVFEAANALKAEKSTTETLRHGETQKYKDNLPQMKAQNTQIEPDVRGREGNSLNVDTGNFSMGSMGLPKPERRDVALPRLTADATRTLPTIPLGHFDPDASTDQPRPRARDLGIKVGVLPPGSLNAITDVAGVKVGHTTLIRGENVRTGVTAILPHGGNLFREKVPGAVFVGNAFGKLIGSTQVNELGEIETPILLTSTLSTPRVADALITYMLGLKGNEDVQSVNPLVGETNDGYLNDIRSRPITEQDVFAAIGNAREGPVNEGCVGAGTGTIAFGFKGGIGTSSRRLPLGLGGYTVGVLVQSNFGGILTIAGAPVGRELGSYYLKDQLADKDSDDKRQDANGSIMIVMATDAPIDHRNLSRLAARAMMGLGRTGSSGSNGSGDFVIAFSTAPELRIPPGNLRSEPKMLLGNEAMSPLFEAVIEATEEAIYNSLFRACDMGGRGHTIKALPLKETVDVLRKYGVVSGAANR